MAWFRFYDDAVDNPKVQRLPLLLFRAWVNLMCISKQNGGVLPPIEDVAYKLRVTQVRAEYFITELQKARLIDQREDTHLEMHEWGTHQFQSDVSTERVKRFRNKPGNVNETFQPPFQQSEQSRTEQNRAEQIGTPETPPAKPPKGKTQVPLEFAITGQMRDWARLEGFTDQQVDSETEKMRDHFRAKGEKRADWIATWRNWLRNSRQYAARAAVGGRNGSGQQREADLGAAKDFVSRKLAETVRGGVPDVREDAGGFPGKV